MSGVLDGKVALVTGAGTGLGRGIAQALAEAGADVAVAEINGESGEVAARELAETGVRTKAYETDVAKSDQVERAFTSCVADLGRIDIVVNNAGISRVGPHTQDVTDEDWADSIAVMQSGVFYCMRAAGRIMIDQGSGSVINISSIRGYSPNPGRMTYCAPKAAVIMMTKIAAGEWAQFGVRANAIAPGVLRTPMWDADVERGAIDEGFYLDMVPAKRLGMPSEVGALAVYLALGRRVLRQRLDHPHRRSADGDPRRLSRCPSSPSSQQTPCASRASRAAWPWSPDRAAASACAWPRRFARWARRWRGSTSATPRRGSTWRCPPTSATRPRSIVRSPGPSPSWARWRCWSRAPACSRRW